MELSSDQQRARERIHDAIGKRQRVVTLSGPAGSGKTTLMRAVVDDFDERRHVVLMCPTGKAASVLARKTGRKTTTIHSALYSGVHDGEDGKPIFTAPKDPCGAGTLVICDEASMVGQLLHDTILRHMPRDAQILYLGDNQQLPPVNEPWGPNLEAPDAELTEVHRQGANNPILGLATAIRTRTGAPWSGWKAGRCELATGDPAEWLAGLLTSGEDATVLAYLNRTRRDLNRRVRAVLGQRGRIAVGDRLVCCLNNKTVGLMNGEVVRVVDVLEGGPLMRLMVHDGRKRLIVRTFSGLLGSRVADFKEKNDARKDRGDTEDDVLLFDYGFALTIHKAQGSEWDRVGLMRTGLDAGWMSPEDRRRLVYTGVTRAKRQLAIFGSRRAA